MGESGGFILCDQIPNDSRPGAQTSPWRIHHSFVDLLLLMAAWTGPPLLQMGKGGQCGKGMETNRVDGAPIQAHCIRNTPRQHRSSADVSLESGFVASMMKKGNHRVPVGLNQVNQALQCPPCLLYTSPSPRD